MGTVLNRIEADFRYKKIWLLHMYIKYLKLSILRPNVRKALLPAKLLSPAKKTLRILCSGTVQLTPI